MTSIPKSTDSAHDFLQDSTKFEKLIRRLGSKSGVRSCMSRLGFNSDSIDDFLDNGYPIEALRKAMDKWLSRDPDMSQLVAVIELKKTEFA
jgi:hypothetical protein